VRHTSISAISVAETLQSTKRLSAVGSLCLIAAVFLMAACSEKGGSAASRNSANRTLLTPSAAQAEYEQASGELILPAGAAAFPPTLPATQQATVYEKGFATSVAERYWICSWEREWLAQRSRDASRATRALTELNKAPATEFISQHLDDEGRGLFAEYLIKAGLDDPSGLQQDFSQNCFG
jgi:hypothetical protein